MKDGIYISTINLKKFKNLSFPSDGLKLNDLNILIGPNGSGKSNFTGILKFLNRVLLLSQDHTSDLSEFEKAIIDLGEDMILDATLKAPDVVGLECRFALSGQQDKIYVFELGISVKGRAGTSPVIKYEALSQPDSQKQMDKPFYFYRAHNHENGKGVVSVFDSPQSNQTHFEKLEPVPVNRTLFSSVSELLEETSLPPEQTPIYIVRRKLSDAVSTWRFYNANEMNLKEIRESEPKITGHTELYLLPSGENLPNVLSCLCTLDFTFDELLNQEIRKILPRSRKIRAINSGRLRLMIEWYLEGIEQNFHLSDMSDGTVRMLCWAVILLSPKLPALIVLDEPEIGLHPAWMKTLAQWITIASQKTQIFVNTHSPDLLDHFTEQHEKVICFNYDSKHHFSPESLPENLLKTKLDEGWELGDLYRVGDPAIGGWPW